MNCELCELVEQTNPATWSETGDKDYLDVPGKNSLALCDSCKIEAQSSNFGFKTMFRGLK